MSGLATKTSLTSYLQTATFNSKVTEVENKIKATDITAKSSNTKANTIRSDLTAYAKKAEVATDITAIKNDYVTNASLISQLNDSKSQHIATEVTGIDNKTKKNASDILALENRLTQKEDTINENERGLSFNRGFFYYLQQSHLVYECKSGLFDFTINKISTWKSGGIFSNISDSNMIPVKNTSGDLPESKVDDNLCIYLSGNHFQQNNRIITTINKVISIPSVNIYFVYKLDPIASSRDTTFTIQNALFGVMEITKNADTSKYKYKGYGICFDKGGLFSIGYINNGRNVLIFGVHEDSVIHGNNKANNIFVMGDGFTQGINDTTLHAENFTQPSTKFVLSLHYNGDDSYLFVNGRQELKFKAKVDQIINVNQKKQDYMEIFMIL